MTLYPRFTMRTPVAVIRLEGEIDAGMSGQIAQALTEAAGQPVVLIINSGGGIAMEGAAMAAEIQRHGMVDAFGQGIVASAATLPFTAARRKVLHSQCAFMIHDPAALVGGAADGLRKAADDLDKVAGIYADHYARVTGLSAATIRDWMVEETWMTAEEAKALRFCDEIETQIEPQQVARADYTAFRNAPEGLIRMTAANGWAKPVNRPEQDTNNA